MEGGWVDDDGSEVLLAEGLYQLPRPIPCRPFLFLLDRDLEVAGGDDLVVSSAAFVDELSSCQIRGTVT